MVSWFRADRIPFAVTGGLALHAYGLSRFTADIDLLLPVAFQDPVIERMEAEGYETLYRSAGYSNHVHSDSERGRVDFIWLDPDTAAKIFRTSTVISVQAVELPVPRPEYLVAMKLQAIRNDPSRRLRDLADIQHLLSLPAIDQEEVRGYFQRYDLLDDYDQVRR